MMQELIAAFIVLCAAFAVAKRYLPASVTAPLRGGLARFARKRGWTKFEQRLQAAPKSSACGDGCNSCDGCGTARQDAGTDTHPIVFKKR